jgi:predicted alpha-1,2-mannosidase
MPTLRQGGPVRRAVILLPLALAIAAGVITAAPSALVQPAPAAEAPSDLAAYVNPFVGTKPGGTDFGTGGGAGNTFPGADVPFGMAQWSPDTDKSQPGGYYYDDDKIRGFSLTHLSGAGCDGAQDLPFMPHVGKVTTSPAASPDTYLDRFSHADESATAGYYRVKTASGTKVELSATQRSGAARLTYPAGKPASLLVNVSGSIGGTSDAEATITGDRTISGYVASGHFCGGDNRYRLHFSATFDRSFASVGTWHNDTVTPGGERVRGAARAKVHTTKDEGTRTDHTPVSVSGPGSGAYVTFGTPTAKAATVGVKVGLSYVSVAGAAANARAEQGKTLFTGVVARAREAWNKRLNQIRIDGGTKAQRTTFYTALYHSLLQPNVFSDSDGRYMGFDGRTHTAPKGHAQYANFSGWDIYRSEAQLLALLAPHEAADVAQSMYNQARQAGDVWDRWSVNNDFQGVMTGDPYHSVLASMYAFGATGFDAKAALASMVKGATTVQRSTARYVERPGLADYLKLGHLPGDVSTTLEYTTADFGVAALAGRLGEHSTQAAFMKRAQKWQTLFNPSNGWIQPRNRDGSFVTPFDPADSSLYVEGNGAQYHWMVPYDVAGLFDAMGGRDKAVKRLDTFFTELNAGPHKPYAFLGNEPSFETPWLYDYAGAPHRTQEVVRRAVNTLYGPGPDGEVGNDDLGSMSSWYVWAALGMYPQAPGRAELVLASPLFPHITVHRASGQTISVDAPGASAGTYHVQSLKVNGKTSGRAWLPESFVAKGGTLDYTLGTKANTSWGSGAADAPPSFRTGEKPYFTSIDPGRVRVRPGGKGERASVTVRSLRDTPAEVHWAAHPPSGITVTPAAGTVRVPANGTKTATMSVTAAAGTNPGFHSVPLALTADGSALPKATLAVTVGTPGSVLWYLDNNGVAADDTDPKADFDGGGAGYSARALADAGVTPGSTVTSGDFRFTWPDVHPADPDNIVVGGPEQQVLDVPVGKSGATRLSLLGSADHGASSGKLTLTYTDGTTQQETVGLSDWTLGSGRQHPSFGNTIAVRSAYRVSSAAGRDDVDTNVFATAPIALAAGKQLASVTLPRRTDGGTMHVFAIATA